MGLSRRSQGEPRRRAAHALLDRSAQPLPTRNRRRFAMRRRQIRERCALPRHGFAVVVFLSATFTALLPAEVHAQPAPAGGFIETATSTAVRSKLTPAADPGAAAGSRAVQLPCALSHGRRPAHQRDGLPERSGLRELRRLLVLAEHEQSRRQQHDVRGAHAGPRARRRRPHALQLRQDLRARGQGRSALRFIERAQLGHAAKAGISAPRSLTRCISTTGRR